MMTFSREQTMHRLQLDDEGLLALERKGRLESAGDGYSFESVQRYISSSDYYSRILVMLRDLRAGGLSELCLDTMDGQPRLRLTSLGTVRQFPVRDGQSGRTRTCSHLGDLAEFATALRRCAVSA